MEAIGSRRIARIGTVAVLYTALSILLESISFDYIQFRIAEMLILLCLYNKDMIAGVTIGCFAANVFGSIGAYDVIIGTAATFVSGLIIYLLRRRLNVVTASLIAVVINALAVGGILSAEKDTPFLQNAGGVALGEFVCITLAGSLIIGCAIRKPRFAELVGAEKPYDIRTTQ